MAGRIAAFRCATVACALVVVLVAQARGAVTAEGMPADPRLTSGRLANGLRFWIRPNNKPQGQVDLWLRIGAGARSDPAGLSGVAHFAEHMAYNGSQHFPPGTLVPTFEKHGVSFGKDQNASTSFDETVYYLSLPNTAPELLEQALLCLADFAFGTTDEPAEIEKERGVVLAELRDAEGSGLRLVHQRLPFVFPDEGLESHLGMGSADGVAKVTAQHVRRFRTMHYLPSSANLVVVGAADPATITSLIQRSFAAWHGQRIPAKRPPPLRPSGALRTAVFLDPDLTLATLTWDVVDSPVRMKTAADWKFWLIDGLAERAFAVRMDRLRRDGRLPIQSVWVWLRNTGHPGHLSSMSITMAPQDWKEATSVLFDEWWAASRVGFTEAEVAGAKRALRADLRDATRAVKDNRTIAKDLVWSLAQQAALPSEQQILTFAQTALPQITAHDIAARFSQRFGARGALWMQQPSHATQVQPEDLRTLWEIARKKASAPAAVAEAASDIEKLLAQASGSVQVVAQDEDTRTGVRSYWLSNGARLHTKRMTDNPGRVQARLTLAGGELLETEQTRGRSTAAGSIFNERHTQQVPASQVREFLLGRSISMKQTLSADALGFSLDAGEEDIATGFALARLLLTGGSLTERAVADVKLDAEKQIAYETKQVEGALERADRAMWACDDPRVLALTEGQRAGLTVEASNVWFARHVREAPAELAVVGDAPEEDLQRWGQSLLAALPMRPRIDSRLDKLRSPACGAGTKPSRVTVAAKGAMQARAAIELAWPGPAYLETANIEKLRLAAEIIQAQLLGEIRERLGLAYDVSCYVTAANSLMGDRRVVVRMTVDPAKVTAALASAQAIVTAFLANGPPAAELENVRSQLLRTAEENQQSSTFWASTLSSLNFRGRALDDITNEEQRLRSYTAPDIASAAKRYLAPEQQRQIIVLPGER